MGIKFADRLAWNAEQFHRNLTILEVEIANLIQFDKERTPHQDDEDDTLGHAAELLLFASEQVQEARRILEEGV